MTGIADLYRNLRRPLYSKDARVRLKALFQRRKYDQVRFVVLSWKRTGSNLLCGILHQHPEITMHNELFNPIDIFTYHPKALLRNQEGDRWNVLGRDLWPEAFLDHFWSGRYIDGTWIKKGSKAVGFKSFPDHWAEVQNEHVFFKQIMDDSNIKKLILHREDELAVYVSMKRAELTGNYMTLSYPKDLKITVDPHAFQDFINNYRATFQRKYKSPLEKRDTFRVTYEQMLDETMFEANILPRIWAFLGVNEREPLTKLLETTRQANPSENMAEVIENYHELEFCFRHTDVSHFSTRLLNDISDGNSVGIKPIANDETCSVVNKNNVCSWSLLLPICSRSKPKLDMDHSSSHLSAKFNSNHLADLAVSSHYDSYAAEVDEAFCWALLSNFSQSLAKTSDESQLMKTECIVGIDSDDPIFNNPGARSRIRSMLPCKVQFVTINPESYGQICKIWNRLVRHANYDFIVLLGDDVVLLDDGWQRRIARKFRDISTSTGLPLGAACVALHDVSFPGFPTFPVVHRWHIEKFGSLLPKQFVNQGGDPYLYELYSRFNASAFEIHSRLRNTIGGDGNARYKKHEINWRGQILALNLMHLQDHLKGFTAGAICLDVIVPCYRANNNERLRRIGTLRASVKANIKFWFIIDNPSSEHVKNVRLLADELNSEQLKQDANYFVHVIEYGENRGASYARNVGYNYSTADWNLFLDDDVDPDSHILDAYIGAIIRYPKAKVFCGYTEISPPVNTWTEMLTTCNIMFFYGVSKIVTFPPWGVSANLMVRGARHNPTIQFKRIYPKTGGGEDIDLVFQFKKWYSSIGDQAVVGVPGAKALHPWWHNGDVCYSQINGWAWGDSLCISRWPEKTFLVFPNWIEFIFIGFVPFTAYSGSLLHGLLFSASIATVEHIFLMLNYLSKALQVCNSDRLRSLIVAFGAGTIHSAQEATRLLACIRRLSLFNLFRRMDWNDGQQARIKLYTQLRSFLRFILFVVISWVDLRWCDSESDVSSNYFAEEL